MASENNVKYLDVMTGMRVDHLHSFSSKSGYDSLISVVPKPLAGLSQNALGLARYLPALPVKEITHYLGEGATPLIPSKRFANVSIKNEGVNPSGSFKDRESALTLAYAKQHGWKALSIASSGNAALSAALYARVYGMEITCVVPVHTSPSKLRMIQLFGGKTLLQGETYEDSYHSLLQSPLENCVNITSGACSIRSDGAKTIAYELWEQMGKVPDVIFCPAGNGSLLASVYHGFHELHEWGFTNKKPRMICVQIAGADPIHQAFRAGTWHETITHPVDSLCEAIVASESFCSPKAIWALKETHGDVISVTDEEIKQAAHVAIHEEGIFPELSSASVFAAFTKVYGDIHPHENIVLLSSGSGLKEIEALDALLNGEKND